MHRTKLPVYRRDETSCQWFWDILIFLTRFWGICTAVVMTGVGVDFIYYNHLTGIFILISAIIVLFFEITWAITLFLHVCLRSEYSPVLRFWDMVLWLDRWKKALLYFLLSILLFAKTHHLWLAPVAGGLLVMLALFYLILTLRPRSDYHIREKLLRTREDSFDRFDEQPEVMDDSLPVPGHDSLSDTIADQEVILEM